MHSATPEEILRASPGFQQTMDFLITNDPIVHHIYTQRCGRDMDWMLEPQNLLLIILEMYDRQKETDKKLMQQL